MFFQLTYLDQEQHLQDHLHHMIYLHIKRWFLEVQVLMHLNLEHHLIIIIILADHQTHQWPALYVIPFLPQTLLVLVIINLCHQVTHIMIFFCEQQSHIGEHNFYHIFQSSQIKISVCQKKKYQKSRKV